MLQSFRSYQLAVQFYRLAERQRAPRHLKDQLLRASSTIALNLSEGSAKRSAADRRRVYEIGLGSVRECEAITELLGEAACELREPLDMLARHVFRLVRGVK